MIRLLVVLSLLGPVLSLDARVRDAVQAARAPWLERPMKTLTDIGRPQVVFGGLLIVAAFDAAQGPPTARLALAGLAATNVVVETVKRSVNRARPDGEHKRSNASFPSSHAANAFALAWVLARRYRRWGWAFWTFAASVAWSRVYLNRHYLSDIAVGAAVGVLCAWGAARAIAAWRARRTRTERGPN